MNVLLFEQLVVIGCLTLQRYSFLDIGPLAKGHALVIPKCETSNVSELLVRSLKCSVDHGEKLHDVDDAYLADTLITAKKIAVALGAENYNILQVRNRLCIQQSKANPSFHTFQYVRNRTTAHLHTKKFRMCISTLFRSQMQSKV